MYKEFFIEDIFEIKSGVRLTKANQMLGIIPFVGATDSNNGITEFVSNKNISLDKNVLGVNYNGSVAEVFYHEYECVFSDDVKRLKLKNLTLPNKWIYLFIKQSILQQKCKYRYGYKFNANRMKRQIILLPIDKNGKLNYDFMENYIKILEAKKYIDILKYLSCKG